MEQVAGHVESLAKSKVQEVPPPPFRRRSTKSVQGLDWDPKKYSDVGKESRDERNKKRTIRVFGMEQLGIDEYQKLMREIDSMTGSAELDRIVRKRVQEVKERLENERLAREADERRQTRSQTEGTSMSTEPVPPVPQVGSPRKRKREEENHKETGGKAPKAPEQKKPKALERKETGGKAPKAQEQKEPKAPERKQTAGKTLKTTEQKTPKTTEHKMTGGKKPKKPAIKGPQHVDDDKFELDINTGKSIRKEKPVTEKGDESMSRKRKSTGNTAKPSDTGDESKSQSKKQKKTAAVPLLEDDDNDNDDDLQIIDDEDHDKDYEPENDEENDENYPGIGDDDDNDFEIPPPRAQKTKKELKQTKKQTTMQRRVKKSKTDRDGINQETLSLFQRLVGKDYEVRASEEYEDESAEKRERCLNPIEGAGFRATIKTLALEVKKAVRKGKQIKETYTDMIESTIKIAKAMKYPGAASVETKDILPSIKDIECNAWRKYLQGKRTMEEKDIVMDDEEENPAAEDLLVQQNTLGKEATDAAAEAIKKLPKMQVNDINNKIRNLFSSIEKAHKHAAEATKTLHELHADLPLDVFLRIADIAVRPLVILHIPKTEDLIQKLKEAGVKRMQRLVAGSRNVVDVMVQRNLPTCGNWTTEDEYKPWKMIAGLIHKYLRDEMLKEPTPTRHC